MSSRSAAGGRANSRSKYSAIDVEPNLFAVYQSVLDELEWCNERAMSPGQVLSGEHNQALGDYRQELLATLADYFGVDVPEVRRHFEGWLLLG